MNLESFLALTDQSRDALPHQIAHVLKNPLKVGNAEVVLSPVEVIDLPGLASFFKNLSQEPARDFFGALVENQQHDSTRVIAEIKRKSPSAGTIWKNARTFDPVAIARQYHAAGAAAISCATTTARGRSCSRR